VSAVERRTIFAELSKNVRMPRLLRTRKVSELVVSKRMSKRMEMAMLMTMMTMKKKLMMKRICDTEEEPIVNDDDLVPDNERASD